MTESEVVNDWISQGELTRCRQDILQLLEGRFPGMASSDVKQLIQQQESLPLLDDWFDAAVRASTFEQFMDVLKR